jgi:hypothetical protein
MVQGLSLGLPHFDAPLASRMCGTFLAFMYFTIAVLVGVPMEPTMATT